VYFPSASLHPKLHFNRIDVIEYTIARFNIQLIIPMVGSVNSSQKPWWYKVEKQLFQQFSDAHGNMSRIVIADGFVDGFCLGMRIAIEVMEKRL